jgi:predicted metalloendopeptidase
MAKRVMHAAVLCAAILTGGGASPGTTVGTHAARLGSWGVDLAGRDESVRPQDDFFDYANGQWLEDFEIPQDLAMYGSFVQLWLDSEEQVRTIIQDAAAEDAPAGSPARKIGDLYADYLDDDAREAAGLSPLAKNLAEIRAAESRERLAALLAKAVRTGGSTPFTYYVDQDPNDPTRYLPHFFQGGLGLPDREYYLDEENPRFAKARDAYREYLTTLLTIAGEADPAGEADAVLALETRLAEAHWPTEETRDVERTNNTMTRAELAEAAPGMAWDAYLDGLGLAPDQDMLVMMPSAYAGMAEAFAETPLDVWRAYLVERLLSDHASVLPKAVDDANFRFTSEALSGAEEQRARWKRGVQFVNHAMGEAVGELYVRKHFSETAKRRIDELVSNLLVAMDRRIDGLEWMSPETKMRAHEKLSKFNVKVGYPDEWRDYSTLDVRRGDLFGNARRAAAFEYDRNLAKLGAPVDRGEWLMNPQTVNAYYNPNMNEIVFPAAILQPPFFDPYADDAVNYGGIGAVIGHEIGHGFDDQGRKSDGDGALRDWWTAEDAERFGKRAQVLVEQYDGFSPIDGMHINGELTLGENIGDLGGLEIAYHAYHLSLDGKEPPVVDGLTGDQRFFLGFAQIWRGKVREELMAQLLASNEHSPVEYRVNGTLRNVDAWYAAFGVQPGDAMYLDPDRRVHIW